MRHALPLFFAALLLAACEPPTPKFAGSGMDMFAPLSMRLHPLSRIVTPANAPPTTTVTPALEARIELSDQFQDPGKGVGTLSLQLFDQPPLSHKGPLLASWMLPIDTPESNRDRWDRMTRTYFFKLPITVTLPNREKILLVATLTLPNGQTLTDELELPLK